MERVEKTVFISYRRTNFPWAMAVWQNLTHHGYDVFIDYQGIASGDFESTIIENIRARAHFLIVLTPSALERCSEHGDLMRREIETALVSKRNIVPLMLEDFSFSAPAIADQLTGTLAQIKRYNGLSVPNAYFLKAMEDLRHRFLNVPLAAVIHPPSLPAQRAAREQNAAAEAAPPVQEQELTAQQYFERGVASTDPDEQIRFNAEAIRLKPDFFEAYNNRGNARKDKGDIDGAIIDYNEAIRLKPDAVLAFSNRSVARRIRDDLDGAITDCDEAIRLKPDFAQAYNNRGIAHKLKGDLDAALIDFNEAIRLEPDYAEAYSNRGGARQATGDLDGELADYDEAIRLEPDLATAYYNRGNRYQIEGDLINALEDYDKAIRLEPDYAEAYNNRALARETNGDLDGALSDYNETIRLRPDLAEAYNNRAVARRRKGDVTGALSDYEMAIRLKPDVADVFLNRGALLREQGRYAAAIADLRQYLRLGTGTREGNTEKAIQLIRDLQTKLLPRSNVRFRR